MKKLFVKLLCAFIPSKKMRKKIRAKLLPYHDPVSFKHHIYGKSYYPIYNSSVELNSVEPEIYNAHGERYSVCFIRDIHFAHEPNYYSRHIYWGRYNFGLPVHFYTHNSMLETMGTPAKQYGWLCESKSIAPQDYQLFDKYDGLHKKFNLIFTCDEEFLNKFDNARFVPATGFWYGIHPLGGGSLSDKAYETKALNISMIASNKCTCEMHRRRIELAKYLRSKRLADCFGRFDGGERFSQKASTLQNYRYQVAFENDISPYYFTEKLLDCFAAMTVPIYIGASKISEFFNTNGIIQVSLSDLNNIDNILSQCSEKDYEQRLPAILDNYNRVKQFHNVPDYIYKKYLNN